MAKHSKIYKKRRWGNEEILTFSCTAYLNICLDTEVIEVTTMSDEPSPQSEIILYQTEDGGTRLQVRLDGQTAWLSLNQMAELFQRDKSVISRHIKNVFEEGELSRTATVAKSATVQTEGEKQVTRDIEFYNLDVIISVGYRVKSLRGTQFRIWATQRLREYIVKGFAMDDERLKQSGGGAYFDELLERIRDIRSAEKVFWRKVLVWISCASATARFSLTRAR